VLSNTVSYREETIFHEKKYNWLVIASTSSSSISSGKAKNLNKRKPYGSKDAIIRLAQIHGSKKISFKIKELQFKKVEF
jgi:hypothetical protein